MWWCRRHQRFAGILALFALGIQIAVSFGHVHLEGAGAPFAASTWNSASLERLPSGAPDSPAAPRHPCAVCVTIGLLGNALTGEPPALPLPARFRFGPLPPVDESIISVSRFYPFRTRAPPAS
jgi:hypothetical protein